MGRKSAAVDAYIAKSAPFARPILKRIRAAFHKGCPKVEETIKWGVPHFDHHGIMGSMAAFKAHVGWGFWKSKLMKDPRRIMRGDGATAMGGMRVTALGELPAESVMVAYIKEAARLNEAGVKAPRSAARKRDPDSIKPPADFMAALRKDRKALATYQGFPWSKRNDYVEWITEAKQAATRARRIAQSVEWLAEGKSRHWKYEKAKA